MSPKASRLIRHFANAVRVEEMRGIYPFEQHDEILERLAKARKALVSYISRLEKGKQR